MNHGVGAIIIKNRKILLLLRKESPDKGLWSLPGGQVEVGENLEMAIKREVSEEIGVKVTHAELVESFTYEVVADNFACMSNILKVNIEGKASNVEKNIHEEIFWFDIDALPPNITTPVQRALLYIAKDYLENIDE